MPLEFPPESCAEQRIPAAWREAPGAFRASGRRVPVSIAVSVPPFQGRPAAVSCVFRSNKLYGHVSGERLRPAAMLHGSRG